MAASTVIYTHLRNAVPLVWGLAQACPEHLLAPTPTFLHIGKMYVESFYSFICSSVCTKSTSLPPGEIYCGYQL